MWLQLPFLLSNIRGPTAMDHWNGGTGRAAGGITGHHGKSSYKVAELTSMLISKGSVTAYPVNTISNLYDEGGYNRGNL